MTHSADADLSTITTGGPQVRIAPDVHARWVRYMGRMQADMSRPPGRVSLQDAMRDALDRAESQLEAASSDAQYRYQVTRGGTEAQ